MPLGIACSIAPDIDVIAAFFGVHHGDLLGHRGFTHSLICAAAFASVAFFAVPRTLNPPVNQVLVWTYLFLAAASHGLLDALTDRSGLGIPFFWPFDSTRYFFPFTPIAMSPIGTHFFSGHGLMVLLSELRWVWIPSLVFSGLAVLIRHFLIRRSIRNDK
jgi:inner membrane protein